MKLSTGVRSIFINAILLGLALGLQACGGGGSAPVNAAPVFTSAAIISVDENNTATGYTAAATDAENNTVTFSLTGGTDQAKFSIDTSSGVLSFQTPVNFESPTDSDTNNTYAVEISASDGSLTTVKSIIVTVTDVDATGYYDITGTATVKDDDTATGLNVTDLQAMISNNRMIMLSKAAGLVYDGTMAINNDNSYTATVKVYRNGLFQEDATIAGTLTESASISGTLTGGTRAGVGTFNLVYSLSDNTAANITRVESITNNTRWVGRLYDESSNNFEYRFRIISPNTFEYFDGTQAGTFNSCGYGGNVTPINNTSLYLIEVTELGFCDDLNIRDKSFTGFAVSRTQSSTDDTLVYVIIDSSSSYAVMTEAMTEAN